MSVYYITNCGYGDEHGCRAVTLSAVNKSIYISSLLSQLGITWTNVCAPLSQKGEIGFPTQHVEGNFGESVIVGPSLHYKSSIGLLLAKIFQRLWFTFFILFNVHKGDTVIAYHSLEKLFPLLVLKHIKRANLILEVEEIYGKIAHNMNKIKKEMETNILQMADAYIIPNPSLMTYIHNDTKRFCVIEGNIHSENRIANPPDDSRIHVVYSGIINQDKGAKMITDIAKYLTDGFLLHIIGFGSEEDVAALNDQISKHNLNLTTAHVVYDGIKKGKDYIEYLQKCHIGLCPQVVDDDYNDASFPSKISSYLSNGLRVVATDTNAVRNSRLSRFIRTAPYDAKAIAETIKDVDVLSCYPIKEALDSLAEEQIHDLKRLISE